MTPITLRRSTRSGKKYQVRVGSRTIHFGADGYSDFTKHKDPQRKKRYLARHRTRENWTRSGIHTAGFWSRWLLWNQPTLTASIRDIERRFNVDIRRG
jgi:hypothetical protein